MNILGLKLTDHDSGAALISEGRVIAISEERLNREKHSGTFPTRAIQYCLDALALTPGDIDHVVMDQVDLPSVKPMEDIFRRETGGQFQKAALHVINHHDAHAASAFFCSPFDEAAVLVYDGAGEKFATPFGVAATETESLYTGSARTLLLIQKTLHRREGKVFPHTLGIGKLYTYVSEKYLSFGPYNEGKMMGLAPYGTDALLKCIPPPQWFRLWNGHVVCNGRVTFPPRPLRLLVRRTTTFAGKARVVLGALHSALTRWVSRWHRAGSDTPGELFGEISLERPPREPHQQLPDDYYTAVAWAVQHILELVAVAWGKQLKDVTRAENLCVAGGVGLNIDANKRFLDEVGFKRVFIQPASSDAGIPLGCALWGYHVIGQQPRFWQMESASLGRPYQEEEIVAALGRFGDAITARRSHNIAEETARLLASGKIIGWFQGGSEYGPRALGHRSILCDPRPKDMKDILNVRVKHREAWRPFAASILREQVSGWFEFDQESPFMLMAVNVKPDKRDLIPAVVHVDGTTRIQTVTAQTNGRYYDLIAAFYRMTGVPLLLNTSFNDSGEPIMETPEEAIRGFLHMDMNCLVMEEYLITKKK